MRLIKRAGRVAAGDLGFLSVDWVVVVAAIVALIVATIGHVEAQSAAGRVQAVAPVTAAPLR